jgi:hypothetical protein
MELGHMEIVVFDLLSNAVFISMDAEGAVNTSR